MYTHKKKYRPEGRYSHKFSIIQTLSLEHPKESNAQKSFKLV